MKQEKHEKKNVRYEESFIFSVDKMRRHVNEVVLAIPFILAFAWMILGAPLVVGLCEVPVWTYPLLLVCPPGIVILIFYVRKRIILTHFLRVRDVKDRVELTDMQSPDLETFVEEKVFMFVFSDYMVEVLYNWLYSLGVIPDGKLKMYKVYYDNHAPLSLAIREADLTISDDVSDRYKAETRLCLLASDLIKGKTVDMRKLCERITFEEGK